LWCTLSPTAGERRRRGKKGEWYVVKGKGLKGETRVFSSFTTVECKRGRGRSHLGERPGASMIWTREKKKGWEDSFFGGRQRREIYFARGTEEKKKRRLEREQMC